MNCSLIQSWKNLDCEGPLEAIWPNIQLEAGLPRMLDQVALGLLPSNLKIPKDGDPQSLWQLVPMPSHCEISFFFLFPWPLVVTLVLLLSISEKPLPCSSLCPPSDSWTGVCDCNASCGLLLGGLSQPGCLTRSLNAVCCSPVVVLLAFLQFYGTCASLSIPFFLCWGAQKWLRCSWCGFTSA